jgi:regulator of nucleoside diphosphate kinase
MSSLLVTEADYANLSLLESPRLRRRLAGATRVPSEAIPDDVVTMNSMVRYRDTGSGEHAQVQIVYPTDARSRLRNRCSVLSPQGLALLGARVGETVSYRVGGERRELRIEAVLHQPESSLDKYLVVRR